MAEKNQIEIDDLKAPLLAAVGAADLALERVNEIVATLRDRAGDARTDAEARAEKSRARITKLQEELPTQFEDIRDRLTSEELRKFAESYAETAQSTYNKLIERGEAALERLRSQPAQAWTLLHRAELHRQLGRPDDASTDANQSRQIFERCGAVGHARRAAALA